MLVSIVTKEDPLTCGVFCTYSFDGLKDKKRIKYSFWSSTLQEALCISATNKFLSYVRSSSLLLN